MNIFDTQSDLWSRLKEEKGHILIYGMGNGTDKLISRLSELGIEYSDVFASDEFVRGQSFHGRRVLTFSEARRTYGSFTVLLGFATTLPGVISHIEEIASVCPLYVPDMPVCGTKYFDAEFAAEHIASLEEVYHMLADDSSRAVMKSAVEGKLHGRPSRILSHTTGREEKYRLLSLSSAECAVDAGAYRGDTAAEMLEYAPNIKEIIAVEPDRKSYEKLLAFSRSAPCTVRCINAALGDRAGETLFSQKGNRGSFSGTQSSEKQISVPVTTVDMLCSQKKPDYIKYDVEGAEAAALAGSADTVLRHRPALLVSLYHRAEDIFALPAAVCRICPEYDFYMRRRRCLPVWELELIAIPKERK